MEPLDVRRRGIKDVPERPAGEPIEAAQLFEEGVGGFHTVDRRPLADQPLARLGGTHPATKGPEARIRQVRSAQAIQESARRISCSAIDDDFVRPGLRKDNTEHRPPDAYP